MVLCPYSELLLLIGQKMIVIALYRFNLKTLIGVDEIGKHPE